MTALPPGPRAPGILQLARWLRDPEGLLADAQRAFGDVFTLDLSVLSKATVVVSNPAHIREVLVAPDDVLSAADASDVFEPFVGRGSLFLIDGADHARHRRLMGPAFRGERINAYFDDLIASVDRVAARWTQGAAFSFYEAMRGVTLDALVRVVFGPRGSAALADFGARAREMVDICAKPHLLVPAARIDLGAWSPWGKVLRTMKQLDQQIYAHIDRARTDSASAERDVMAALLDARDNDGRPLSRGELRDELVTLLIAGSETTAAGLAWTMDELLRAPDQLELVVRELAEVSGSTGLRAEHVPSLRRLEHAVLETLRLHPPILNVIRVVKKPFRIAGHELAPGVEIAPCMWLTHRRAELYPSPLEFVPSRFERKPDAYSYFPFGGGNRRCMGMSLALYELTVVLARLLGRFRFRFAREERPLSRRRALLMTPSTGVPVFAQAHSV